MKDVSQSLQLQHRGRRVLVVLAGVCAAAHSAMAARELAHVIRKVAETALLISGVEQPGQAVATGRFRTTVRYDGNELHLVFEPGNWLIKWPVAEWKFWWTSLLGLSARVDEWDNAARVARDHAIMLRAGAPIGLTSDPIIQAEAKKIAEGDRDLRRFMPKLKATRMTSTPVIIQDTRTPFDRALDEVRRMPPAERSKLLKELQP